MASNPASFVYVIAIGDGTAKIGISRDPTRRLRALQTGCPLKLRLCHTVAMDEYTAMRTEYRAHQLLKSHAMSGEWFSVTPDFALRVVKLARRHVERLGADNWTTNRAAKTFADKVAAHNRRAA
jgi:predicted GIY-YIG superfamily endonuclease